MMTFSHVFAGTQMWVWIVPTQNTYMKSTFCAQKTIYYRFPITRANWAFMKPDGSCFS